MSSLANLHREAKKYYQSLPTAEKEQLSDFFGQFDEDGDGQVTRKELALAVSDQDRRQIMSYFNILDIDCDGVLDFDECTTLFYLLHVPGKICTKCKSILTTKTCNHCGNAPLRAKPFSIADFTKVS